MSNDEGKGRKRMNIQCPIMKGENRMEAASLVKHATDSNFDSTVKGSKIPTLVDFWAPWCGPCRMQGPIVEKVALRVGAKAKIAKVDVDQAPGVASKFGIRSIPTIMIFKNGKSVKDFVGLRKEDELVAAVEAAQK